MFFHTILLFIINLSFARGTRLDLVMALDYGAIGLTSVLGSFLAVVYN
jgi:hypothetical protein